MKPKLEIPKWAFKPDQWSEAFLRGLVKLVSNWESRRVWEVGVGTGINLVTLHVHARDAKWYFSDYDPRCTRLALENSLHFGLKRKNLHPLQGQWDLVTPPVGSRLKAPKVDVIFGCLPQVPSDSNLAVADRRAHYYNPVRYPRAHFNAFGLGLVETLLVDARNVLIPGGSVVLNLGGRPGRKRLLDLFQQARYTPLIVHSETIEQHASTSLASLAALEKNGHGDFEFFADAFCRQLLNAQEGEKRRREGKKVYHKIYVIAGKLT